MLQARIALVLHRQTLSRTALPPRRSPHLPSPRTALQRRASTGLWPFRRIMEAVTKAAEWVAPVVELPQDRLVWVDCEMTGLDLSKDQIIEIACIITDKDLEPLHEGIEYVIHADKALLDGMDEWCRNQHGKTGLTAASLSSPHTLESIDPLLLDYIQTYIPRPGSALLAGNSVHADKAFMKKDLPMTSKHLHYRICDVSSIKELARRWRPDLLSLAPKANKPEASHRALDDIKASIEELAFYRDHFFKLKP